MDNLLQEHGAKHVYRVPEGLRELCSDISREVLRTQPQDIYCYIADYVDALLITRENAKVAVRVVNNILLGSEAIVGILHRTGLSLAQIAVAAPRLQEAFRSYLDTVDIQPKQPCRDIADHFGYTDMKLSKKEVIKTKLSSQEKEVYDDKSRISVRNIFETTGASVEKAERAATMIQSAFRGHYERMVEREAKGEIQWQRAASNTMEILKKAGVSQAEATNAATLIQAAYRGYYTRRNRKMECVREDKDPNPEHDLPGSRQTIQAVAWLDMMYEDSGLTPQRANQAATLIQSVYRGYKTRRSSDSAKRTSSANPLVVDAIVENVRHRIFEKVLSRQDIPQEFGSQWDVEVLAGKIENAYKKRLRESRLSSETDADRIYEGADSKGDEAEVDPQDNVDKNEIQVSKEVVNDSTRQKSTEETIQHSNHTVMDDEQEVEDEEGVSN